MRPIFYALLAAALVAPAAHAQTSPLTPVSCATNSSGAPTTPNGRIAWPTAAPVWEFDLYRPANRTTSQGTGIELRNVRYRGRKVLERAGVPVLNVEYDAGCNCFRDWQYAEASFVADNPVSSFSCLAESTAGSVRTNCTADGAPGPVPDQGSFRGVAVEDYGTELVLTTNMSAGWYRYQMRWHFYTDGRIWPEYSFAAASNACTSGSRRHHAYWRFDFDLEGTPNDDVVTETSATASPITFATEASRTWRTPADGVQWSVSDGATGAGFRLTPGAADLETPVDAFSKTDFLVLRYRTTELVDGGGCAFGFEPWVNNETLTGQDIVVWFRSSTYRPQGASLCEVAGPTLTPSGFAVQTEAPAPDATSEIEIQAATPNPFTPQTSVRFRAARDQMVRVSLYDAQGRLVSVLFDGAVTGGAYETVEVASGSLPVGIYVVRVDGERGVASTRLTLVR